MAFEKFRKVVQNVTDTTVKKTGEQVRITKLSLEKTNLEKEIDALYTKIGRHCYTLSKSGESFDDAITASIAEVDTLAAQVAELESRISAHKAERDSAQYQLRFDDEPDPEIEVEVYTAEDLPDDEAGESFAEKAEELFEDGKEAAAEKLEDVKEAARQAAETVAEKAEAAVEKVEETAENLFRHED